MKESGTARWRISVSYTHLVEEYAEDIKRQQRQNDGTYHSYDNFLKITCHVFPVSYTHLGCAGRKLIIQSLIHGADSQNGIK